MSLIGCLKILIPALADELASYFIGKETGTKSSPEKYMQALGYN